MGLKKKSVASYGNYLFQLRVDCDLDHERIRGMSSRIQEYFKVRGFEMLRHTVGYHEITIQHSPHIHFHAEVKTTKGLGKSPELYYFKKFKNADEFQKSSIKLTKPQTADGSDNDVEESIMKCLRYPLKEGHLIEYSGIDDIDLQMKTAQAEFKFAREQTAKNEAKKAQDKLKWSKIVSYLDSKQPKTLEDAFSFLLDFLRDESPTPSPASICRLSYNYSYKRKLLSNSEIIANELKHFKHVKNETVSNIDFVNNFLETLDDDSDEEQNCGTFVQLN